MVHAAYPGLVDEVHQQVVVTVQRDLEVLLVLHGGEHEDVVAERQVLTGSPEQVAVAAPDHVVEVVDPLDRPGCQRLDLGPGGLPGDVVAEDHVPVHVLRSHDALTLVRHRAQGTGQHQIVVHLEIPGSEAGRVTLEFHVVVVVVGVDVVVGAGAVEVPQPLPVEGLVQPVVVELASGRGLLLPVGVRDPALEQRRPLPLVGLVLLHQVVDRVPEVPGIRGDDFLGERPQTWVGVLAPFHQGVVGEPDANHHVLEHRVADRGRVGVAVEPQAVGTAPLDPETVQDQVGGAADPRQGRLFRLLLPRGGQQDRLAVGVRAARELEVDRRAIRREAVIGQIQRDDLVVVDVGGERDLTSPQMIHVVVPEQEDAVVGAEQGPAVFGRVDPLPLRRLPADEALGSLLPHAAEGGGSQWVGADPHRGLGGGARNVELRPLVVDPRRDDHLVAGHQQRDPLDQGGHGLVRGQSAVALGPVLDVDVDGLGLDQGGQSRHRDQRDPRRSAPPEKSTHPTASAGRRQAHSQRLIPDPDPPRPPPARSPRTRSGSMRT